MTVFEKITKDSVTLAAFIEMVANCCDAGECHSCPLSTSLPTCTGDTILTMLNLDEVNWSNKLKRQIAECRCESEANLDHEVKVTIVGDEYDGKVVVKAENQGSNLMSKDELIDYIKRAIDLHNG